MKLLICMKVKYGFPVNVLHSFLRQKDHEIWNNYLKDLSYNICVNQQQGIIYLLIKECMNIEGTKNELMQLPLVKEEFIELDMHEFINFNSISSIFDFTKAPGQ